MKQHIIIISFLFFVFIANSQKTGNILGTVTDDETGNAIPNAEILVLETAQGMVASNKGAFELNNIKPGIYTLYSHVLGYVADTISNVRVEADKNTEVHFSIKTKDIRLGEVVVSATKIEKTIDKIGSPVYVMGLREIEHTEGRNIEEALIKIPGVFTEDRYHNETNIVSFRGIGLHTHSTTGILVLVDGVSLTGAMGRTDFEGIDLENTEKIEILKGPVSALYGPNGISGVMNVVEKKPNQGFHGRAKVSYGSYNTSTLSGNINGGKNDFRYLVKGKYFKTDGYLERSDSKSARVGLKLIQQLDNAGKLQFTADYIDAESNLPGTLNREDFDNRETTASNPNFYAGYEREFVRTNLAYTQNFGEQINLFTNIYYNGTDSEGFYSDKSLAKDDINALGGEIRSQFKHKLFGKKNSIIVGFSLLNEKNDNQVFNRNIETGEIGALTSNGNSSYYLFGAYVEDEFMLTEKLAINLGIRYDLVAYDWTDNLYEDELNTSASTSISSFNPKFGFAYNPTKSLTVFGNIARGFRPPQISQLFVGSSYGGIANPDLKPEYLNNYELGARGDVNNKFIYQVSFYMMNFTDQISSEIIPEIDPDTPVYQNIGKTKHSGMEASLEYRFTKQFNMYANYSYLNARFDDDLENDNKTLRKTPHNMFNTGLSYRFKFGLTASIDYRFIDKYYMDNEEAMEYEGYSIVNMKVMYKRNGFMVSAAVNNLFDTNYATYAYASEVYDRTTRQSYWVDRYIPGWPVNLNIALSYSF